MKTIWTNQLPNIRLWPIRLSPQICSMKSLLKLTFCFASIFLLIFIFMKVTGTITLEDIKFWLSQANKTSAVVLALIVIALLLSDLLISVPTLATVTLSGYFLGQFTGALTSLIGLLLVGIVGYVLSYYQGAKVESRILKTKQERLEARQQFAEHGVLMILFSRALPMLPEIAACMAGITKMPFTRFIIAWTVSSVPYVLIASYAGSISTLNDPSPAIYAAIALYASLSLGWLIVRKVKVAKR